MSVADEIIYTDERWDLALELAGCIQSQGFIEGSGWACIVATKQELAHAFAESTTLCYQRMDGVYMVFKEDVMSGRRGTGFSFEAPIPEELRRILEARKERAELSEEIGEAKEQRKGGRL